MYSIIFHAHQKLDREARKQLQTLLKTNDNFPSIKQILKFEAGHGPDGAKLKRQKDGQPWHFVNPLDETDTELHQDIRQHYAGLVDALKADDEVRAGFEASWLAHALVDGLTPAHHYPYEAELAELRGGQERDSRKGLAGRLYVKGDSFTKSLLQSLKLVGPKGLLTTHAMFEAGAYAIIAPLSLKDAMPSKKDLKAVATNNDVVDLFKRYAKEVAGYNLYVRFYGLGWTIPISRDVRRQLAPRMVQIITLAWYSAVCEARKAPK